MATAVCIASLQLRLVFSSLVSWTSLMPMSRLPWQTPVRPAPEPPAEPAMVSFPLRAPPAAGAPVAGLAWLPAVAAGAGGGVGAAAGDEQAASNAPTTRHSAASQRDCLNIRASPWGVS